MGEFFQEAGADAFKECAFPFEAGLAGGVGELDFAFDLAARAGWHGEADFPLLGFGIEIDGGGEADGEGAEFVEGHGLGVEGARGAVGEEGDGVGHGRIKF